MFAVGVTVCHNTLLSDPIIASLWQRALQTGLAIRLFRYRAFVFLFLTPSLFVAKKLNSFAKKY